MHSHQCQQHHGFGRDGGPKRITTRLSSCSALPLTRNKKPLRPRTWNSAVFSEQHTLGIRHKELVGYLPLTALGATAGDVLPHEPKYLSNYRGKPFKVLLRTHTVPEDQMTLDLKKTHDRYTMDRRSDYLATLREAARCSRWRPCTVLWLQIRVPSYSSCGRCPWRRRFQSFGCKQSMTIGRNASSWVPDCDKHPKVPPGWRIVFLCSGRTSFSNRRSRRKPGDHH